MVEDVGAEAVADARRHAGSERIPLGLLHLGAVGVYTTFAIWLHARSSFVRTTFGTFSDWTDYQTVTRSSPLSSRFWTGVKPAGYPLLVKLLGEGAGLHWAAVVLSILAWSALALSVAMAFRTPWLATAACAFVLALSLSQRIQVWNDLAGSETLSVSLFVLAVAAGLLLTNARLPSQPSLRVVAWIVLVISVAWWSFTRDSNVYLLVLVGVVAGGCAIRNRSRVLAVVCGAALVVSFVGAVASDAGDRWVVPYYNIVFNRVLTDHDLTAAWRDAGMPDTQALRSHIGEIAYHDDPALFGDPRLATFRRWVSLSGRSTYVVQLITKPSLGVEGPVGDLDALLASPTEVWGHIGGHSYRGSPVDPIANSVFVPDMVPLAAWLALVVVAAGWLLVRVRRSPTRGAAPLLVALMALGVPHLWLVWVGDAHNVARHAVTASVQIRVAGWLILLVALDELLTGRRRDASVGS
jgi:hypothetical protein